MAETGVKPRLARRDLLIDWLCGVTGCIAWAIFFVILVLLIR